MSERASSADFALVGTVGGGLATLILSVLTLGTSAFLGRIPSILVVLLGLAALVTVVSLILTLVARRQP